MDIPRIRRKATAIICLVSIAAVLAVFAGCSHKPGVKETPEKMAGSTEIYPPGFDNNPDSEKLYPSYLSLVDGLHVTGTPIEVDIEKYRLTIKGNIKKPSQFSYEQIMAMDAETIEINLVCPGFFEDTGEWTGVMLSKLLEQLGVNEDAKSVVFNSIDGDYSKTLTKEKVMNSNVLIAYEFDGEPFAVYHGFPLRLAVEDEYGAFWVKWLGTIVVR
jgi:DMSO/TMAO reductase YedYZ molybdopterin-dependent catalytic subunit